MFLAFLDKLEYFFDLRELDNNWAESGLYIIIKSLIMIL